MYESSGLLVYFSEFIVIFQDSLRCSGIAILAETTYLSLRLTFGGAPNPPTWCLFSECVTDVANELGNCTEWDPLTTFSPTQPSVPTPKRVAESAVPHAQAKPMAVIVPYSEGEG